MPLRLRLALVLAAATAVVLVGGGFIFVSQLQKGLVHGVDANLKTRASDIADAVTQPGAKPAGLLEASAHSPLRLGGSQAQILDAHGAVLSSTTASRRPMVSLDTVQSAANSTLHYTEKVEDEQRFIVESVSYHGEPLTIAVRTALESSDSAVDRVQWQLGLAGAPLIFFAGLAGWWLAGAALRPVERMRGQVAELSEDDVGPSLDVPGTRDEVARLARTMNDLLARVRRSRRRERGFVAEAGHELRTPLAILRGELELATRPGRTPEELHAALVVAAEETERLSRLAEALLLLARSDEGAMPFSPRPTDVADLVERSVSAATVRAADRSVDLSVDDRGGGPVDLDPDRYRQAIDNLLDNAIRYAPAGSTVTARIERANGEVRCSVLDDGPGFSPDFVTRALERFAKGDDERNATGAGLGLAIVEAIANAHGGRAWVANRENGGAEATIAVPTGGPS